MFLVVTPCHGLPGTNSSMSRPLSEALELACEPALVVDVVEPAGDSLPSEAGLLMASWIMMLFKAAVVVVLLGVVESELLGHDMVVAGVVTMPDQVLSDRALLASSCFCRLGAEFDMGMTTRWPLVNSLICWATLAAVAASFSGDGSFH